MMHLHTEAPVATAPESAKERCPDGSAAVDSAVAPAAPPQFTDEQRYLFDLHGYVVLRGVVPPEVVARANRAMEHLESLDEADLPPGMALGDVRSSAHLFLSNLLDAGEAFDPFIDVPAVLAVIAGVVGAHHRLNHVYSITRRATGFTGLHMGGTPMVPQAPYAVIGGSIYSPLTKAVFPLLACGEDDGCFAAIPGSHKSAFPRPWGSHPHDNPPLVPIAAEPGDAIVFSEAMTHGSLVNTSGRLRRTLYYCYSQSWTADWTGQHLWYSDALMARLTPARRNLLRLDGGCGGVRVPMRYGT